MDFNEDWFFVRYGAMPDGTTRGEPTGLEKIEIDLSGWRPITLPHDWGIEGPFRAELPNETGKLPWVGIGWYRKIFEISETDRDRQIFIDFDGAMSHAKIWLNGEYIGGWPYGYSSFRLELTKHIRFGEENVLAVRLDNPPNSSRWYPGGGIYRNVRLVKTAPIHVAHRGTVVTIPEVSAKKALVRVATELENRSGRSVHFSVKHEIFEDGKTPVKVAEQIVFEGVVASAKLSIPACLITLQNFKRWDVDSPNLYYVQTSISQGGKDIDSYRTVFGIRTIEFFADRGFLLNGRSLKLNGVCLHHDLGPLGTAVNKRAIERQLEIMKEMGCNAIRTSHNPPAPELLDLCDRMGLMVQVEAFDCWAVGKKVNDYSTLFAEWHEKDLVAMVHRDRNHPSVIMWSTGNEVQEMVSDDHYNPERSQQLTDIIRREDPTRPVSCGCNYPDAGFSGFQKTVDVFGYNYKPHLYERFRKENPEIPLYGSETASCISSRGEYFFPVSDDPGKGIGGDFQVSSYDLYAPPWATTPDIEFKAQDQAPDVCGEFLWTGFDYLGEPTPYNQDKTNLLNFSSMKEREKMEQELEHHGGDIPPRSSYFGAVDLCGFKKDRFYIYQARWRPDLPMVHILPHWNWPERVGKVTPVHVYTSGDEVELFLNGKSLGRKKKGSYEYRLRWDDVIYEPGELQAVAYKDGKNWFEETVRTTGPAAQLLLSADRSEIYADGNDLCFVTASIIDRSGLPVPRSDNLIEFTIDGPAELIAVGNGNPASHEPFQARKRKAFNGLCLAVIRSFADQKGMVTLNAASDRLESGKIVIMVTESNDRTAEE